MADNTVQVTEIVANTVTAQDIINSVTVSESDANSVTVVASTFVNDSGASSKFVLWNDYTFYICHWNYRRFLDTTDTGELYGPKTGSGWPTDSLPLIPKKVCFYSRFCCFKLGNYSHIKSVTLL